MNLESKAKSLDCYNLGMFGNWQTTWDKLKDIPRDYRGLYVLRYRSGAGGRGPCAYHLTYPGLIRKIQDLIAKGWDINKMFFHPQLPEENIILQAEIMLTDLGLHCIYCFEPGHYREVIPYKAKSAYGLTAKMILQSSMDPASYDNCMAFLEDYPEAVLEVTVLDVFCGSTPGRNTFLWEVRNGY